MKEKSEERKLLVWRNVSQFGFRSFKSFQKSKNFISGRNTKIDNEPRELDWSILSVIKEQPLFRCIAIVPSLEGD